MSFIAITMGDDNFHELDAASANASDDELLIYDLSESAYKKTTVALLVGAVKLDDLATPDDNTTLDASTSVHGLCPKLSNNAAQFLNGVGSWVTPAGGGDVAGPASNTDNYLPQWDGADSKTLKNGAEKSTDGTLGDNSDDAVPTEKAVKTYIDAKKLDDLAAPDDTIDLNVSTSKHGLCPKLDDDDTHFLNGKGAWAVPAGGGGSGDVTGPASNTDNSIPQWDGADSKTLKDGLTLATTVGDPGVDTQLVSEQGIREALNAKLAKTGDDSLDLTDTGTSGSDSGGVIDLGNDDGSAMADGHQLGKLNFEGCDGNVQRVGARIRAVADGGWAPGVSPGSLVFDVTNLGSPKEAIRIDSDGHFTTGKLTKVYGPFAFDHADSSPATLFSIPARSRVKRVYVESTETDAGGVDWEIGTSTDTDLFVTNDEMPSVDGDIVDVEAAPKGSNGVFFSAATNALLTITTAGTAGAGRVWVELVTLPTS